jgi:hypothetical protein
MEKMKLTTLISLLADIMDKMDITDKSYKGLSELLTYFVDENNWVGAEYVVNDDEIWVKLKK